MLKQESRAGASRKRNVFYLEISDRVLAEDPLGDNIAYARSRLARLVEATGRARASCLSVAGLDALALQFAHDPSMIYDRRLVEDRIGGGDVATRNVRSGREAPRRTALALRSAVDRAPARFLNGARHKPSTGRSV
jgi:hypothetical protein